MGIPASGCPLCFLVIARAATASPTRLGLSAHGVRHLGAQSIVRLCTELLRFRYRLKAQVTV